MRRLQGRPHVATKPRRPSRHPALTMPGSPGRQVTPAGEGAAKAAAVTASPRVARVAHRRTRPLPETSRT